MLLLLACARAPETTVRPAPVAQVAPPPPTPYVREHLADPVRWRTWTSLSALTEEARASDRLLFVTVGFASCHWCHVMQHESFRDPEIAQVLNDGFVPVVVDREQDPVVDGKMLAAVRALGGNPGWPATVVLTPDGDVVFAGGYLPPRDGPRGVGFLTLLTRLRDGWRADRAGLVAQARANSALVRPTSISSSSIHEAVDRLKARYDREHGGFGAGAKFPNPPLLELALHEAARGDAEMREIVADTARAMADGGLHDAIDGGFHRYTVDAAWQRPHFEKVAADNARLAAWYVDAGLLLGDPSLVDLGARTADALELFARPHGGYGVALDASGDGPDGPIEGLYYTWTSDELTQIGAPWRPLAEFDGRLLVAPTGDVEPLRRARAARPPPRLDDQRLPATDAQVVRAQVRVALAADRPDLLARALANPLPPGRWPDERAAVASAWLDLFEATGDAAWLDRARRALDELHTRYADPDGGWFREADDDEGFWYRTPLTGDALGDVATAYVRVGALTAEPRWAEHVSKTVAREPALALADAARALERPGQQIVVTWPPSADPSALLAVVHRRVLPGRTLLAGEPLPRLPLAEGKGPVERPTAWVCRAGLCDPPRTDADELAAALLP